MADQHSLVSRIKALTKALEGTDIEEMDLTENGTRIVIRRALEPVVPVSGLDAGAEPAAPAPTHDPTVAIVAPLTGVFYGSPSPSAPPYVQVGDSVQAGQVVCIVEAMKVFNEITTRVSGVVTALAAEAGQLVHKGDALIRVRPV